jgi:galactitol-specific phosphotransferase system IIB component
MKKFSFILIAVLLSAAIIGTTYYIRIQNKSNQQEISITDAFNSSGAKMIVNELYFFVRATDNYKNLGSLTSVCAEVFKALEIPNYSKNSTSTDILIKSELLGATKDGVKISAMASIVGNKSGSGDKYITIDALGAEDGTALLLRNKIEKVFIAHGLKTVVNSCITGTYEGNVQDDQLENICRNILSETEAKKVDSLRQENTISVSAFSPMIKDKLSINGKNVNLSLAIRYNKQEKRTYLWVATPIVNAEY